MALVVAHVRPRAARQQELDQRRLRGPVLLSFRVAVVENGTTSSSTRSVTTVREGRLLVAAGGRPGCGDRPVAGGSPRRARSSAARSQPMQSPWRLSWKASGVAAASSLRTSSKRSWPWRRAVVSSYHDTKLHGGEPATCARSARISRWATSKAAQREILADLAHVAPYLTTDPSRFDVDAGLAQLINAKPHALKMSAL